MDGIHIMRPRLHGWIYADPTGVRPVTVAVQCLPTNVSVTSAAAFDDDRYSLADANAHRYQGVSCLLGFQLTQGG